MKIRNLVGAMVALVGITFCGGAFGGGSVWEVLPGTPVGTTHTSNERISFRMRLLSPNWDRVPEAADRFGWRIRLTPYGRTLYSNEYLAWAGSPMKLGVVLNGKTVGADWGRYEAGSDGLKDSGAFVPAKDNIFHDMHFTYTTRCGDYALPLRLAADEKGTPIGGENGNSYFFINGPGDPTAIWEIVAVSNGYDVADYTFESQASTLGPGSSEIKPPYSYNDLDPDEQGNVRRLLTAGDYLRHNDYTVETLKFDDVREKTRTGEEYWRVVSEAGDDSGYVVTADEGFTPTVADTEVYAWIEPDVDRDSPEWTGPASWTANDYAVTIPAGASVTNAFFRDPDGTERYHRVYRIKLGSTASYRVPLHGQHRGRTARVVLASTPHYNYLQDGTGTFLLDYRTAEVYCDEPAAPTVAVSIENLSADRTIRYGSDGTYADARELKVWVNQATNEDMKVKLTFAWGENGANTAFPTNVIAISTDPVDGYLEKNLLKDMEVTIPAGETELPDGKRIYLFVLGATKSTENPEEGITITPVPEAKFASFIQTTNAQPFRIIGMNPGLISPLGTKEEPAALTEIRGGSKLRCRVVLDDSWRNMNLSSNDLAAAGGYTVRWNRGYGSELTITNDYNGNVLKPVMNSDGHAWFDIGVEYTSVTGTYHASFMVTNPEGHESVVSYVDVTTIPRATVTAALPDMPQTPDGFYETMESDTDKRTVRFELSDILEADGQALWAFLEPANEAASNRTDGAFFTVRPNAAAGAKSEGVPVDTMSTGVGSTALNYKLGGIQVLDGDGAGDGSGSTAQYNVILCTQATYAADKVFKGYDGTGAITLLLDNHEPEFKQLVLQQDIGAGYKNVDANVTKGKNVTASVFPDDPIAIEPHKSRGWDDVTRDLVIDPEATNDQVVVRWRVYDVEDDGSEYLIYLQYTFGTTQKFEYEGFNTEGKKRIIAEVQDKDMRLPDTVRKDEEGIFHYYVDPEYDEEGKEDNWDADYSAWGPAFDFTFTVDDAPTVTVTPVGYSAVEADGVPIFSESQLVPFQGLNDPKMGIEIDLGKGYDSTTRFDVFVKIEPATEDAAGKYGWIAPVLTNYTFRGMAKITATVPILDFDGTYRADNRMKGKTKYKVTPYVTNGTVAASYNFQPSYFYVGNVAPELTITTPEFVEYVDNDAMAYEVPKDKVITLDFMAADIWSDLTNMTVSCTVGGGVIEGTDVKTKSIVSVNPADWEDGAFASNFQFRISSPGTNAVTIVAKDKDGDSSVTHKIRFYIEPSKNLYIYPSKPTTPSTDSDDIADYFAASGIGYGRVWADDTATLSGIKYWQHTWSFVPAVASASIYAMGYTNGEQEVWNSSAYPAFVNKNGTHAEGVDGYQTPLKDLDSFFYRWFTKVVAVAGDKGGSGSSSKESAWTAYRPVPQLSKDRSTVAAETMLQLTLPTATAQGSTVFDDTLALALFAREWIWSDNMGDINGDGVPDSHVMKFKLVEDYTGGNDLKDVNYSEDGKTPLCQDYLPLTELISYSHLIPEITSYDNIKNAQAFTPRLKIRGYDDNLNDAVAEFLPNNDGTKTKNPSFIDGANPEKVYETEDGAYDAEKCTVSKVEYLAWREFKAAYEATHGAGMATFDLWSPERPTDPTKADTDNDGITDGYEYYFWYRAHVGWIEIDASGNEIHRRLTGRAYDPRNPGEGTFISSDEIEKRMDPLVNSGEDKTRDTDNDGLPDLLEFEIGTNPFDFDTDGDGLPDGWEIMIGGTDPLMYGSSADALADGERNYDGDAMAISSYALEKNQKPVSLDIEHAKFTTFAVIKDDGDTDGVQWYAVRGAPEDVLLTTATNGAAGWSFRLEGDDRDYVWYGEKLPVTADGKRLAATLEKGRGASGAYVSSAPVDVVTNGVEEVDNPENPGEMIAKDVLITNKLAGALYPVRLAAGTPIKSVLEKPVDVEVQSLASNIEAKVAFACWIYGKGPKNASYGEVAETAADYGCLALGRNLAAAKGAQVVALPGDTRDVAFLHYLVYQEFGFDPRTAWCAKDPVHSRWGKTTSDGQASEGVTVLKQGGYTGAPARTREYRAYDEFLVYSFFLNNGCDMTGYTTASDEAPYLGQVWMAFCTNPRGPNEPEWVNDEHYTGWTAMSLNGTNGADTDGDGVPDGWELYVMAGPKNKNGSYVFAPPYAGFAGSLSGEAGKLEKSYFSPFMKFAKEQQTNNQIYLGGQQNDDGLNEYREFEGTDSTGWYANAQDGSTTPFSTTVVHDGEWTWFNKFFPTDPWNFDTDGDGLNDAAEKSAFAYGTPADDGKLWSIPGGGLNPCSVDTDLDGLPDPWELQFKPKDYSNIYPDDADPKPFRVKVDDNEVGNPLEGLTDGMDGTVPDAYNVVNGDSSVESSAQTTWTVIESDGRRWSGHVDRDYDHDGLENWQEYLVGTMRCWRYDDPVSPWTAFDESVYFDEDGDFDPVRSAEILGIGGGDDDEKAAAFWYETLVNSAGPFYNPHFITGMSPAAQYFTRVKNPWDTAYLDAELSGGKVDGAYYYFKDRVGANKIEDTWSKILPLPDGSRTAPSKYISCSPIDWDTDCDGMDDYYELFHGLNPILGASGVKTDTGNACDIVYDAWCNTSALEAYGSGDTKNFWQRNPWKAARGTNGMDFEVFPYLNGLVTADPDGDDIRNDEEFLSTREKDIGSHTDPTPLWMTDSSYSNSLVRLHYRVPMRTKGISLRSAEEFTYNDVTYRFTDFDGFGPVGLGTGFMPFNLDAFWGVAADDEPNWMFSFEENEGFDTDHDALGDREERDGLYRAATDPLDADSPRRRQAMYFPGANAALQTMPEVREEYPVATKTWPTDPSFLNFTVECWVKPEDLTRDQTVVERAIWTDPSNPGDQEYLRRNFQIALRGGKWMAKYDSGTLTNDEVKAFSTAPAEVKWTHLAATFDGSEFRLYVDGICQNGNTCGVKTLPENGVSAYAFVKGAAEGSTKRAGDYAWDVKYECKAILVGASFKGYAEGGRPEALDVTSALGWGYYRDFFQGYVDEIRIWDGARTVDEIRADLGKRYTAEDASENRKAFYKQWANGEDRYAKATTVRVVPELRYHFHFDSVPGAADAESVMKVPTGFQSAGGKPVLSRPVGYAIDWFASVAGGYGTVYGPDFDWIQWIPNTVAHLPRYDGTTLDSFFWSEEYSGKSTDANEFERSAEPVSRWTQMAYNGADNSALYKTTPMRHHFVYEVQNASSNGMSAVRRQRLLTDYRFSGRHLNQMGDDLLPLGGAFVKYAPDLWDGQGPSTQWEHTGVDSSANMLPDWYEEYVRKTYGLEGEIDPDTDVFAFGRSMKVRDLYLRDLARGIVLTADGRSGEFDPARVQIADEDGNGVPDWWAEFYRVDGESGLDDHDNDGLPNYVEYLLSEVFDFEVLFDPTVADSVQPGIPDYFYRVGELYVGEIFTDHDLVDDSWEDLFDVKYASRLAWDADADADDDGWSNRSECRSHYWGAGFFPDIIDTFVGGSIDNQLRCFPQPAIRLKVSYTGHLDPKWSSLIVKAWRTNEYSCAATFQIDSLKKATESSSGGMEKTQVLGVYSGRPVMRGYLHPGLLVPSSVKIQKAKISSELTYFWHCTECTPPDHVGSYAEYKADIDHHGEAKTDPNNLGVTLNKTSLLWETFVSARGGSDGQHGAFYFQDNDSGEESVEEVGTINYRTGEYSIDLDLLKEKFGCDFDGMAFKASFAYALGEYWPQTVYLSYPEDRYVREGKNNLEAFFDLNGDGVWQIGEPYGIVRDVDVSWAGAAAAIELTDLSPVTPRIMLAGSEEGGKETGTKSDEGESSGASEDDPSSDRLGTSVEWILQDAIAHNKEDRMRLENNRIETVSLTPGSFKGQRIRVVRWLINDVPVRAAGAAPRVVLDKTIQTDVRTCFTEADILDGNENAFDLDWGNLYRDVINDGGVWDAIGGEVTRMCYLIVVGDGDVGWDLSTSTNVVKALPTAIVRKFGENYVTPVAIAPGAEKEETVHSANPTFKWKMDCPEEEGYTAFSVQVLDGMKVIYDSDKQLAPPRNIDGEYVWDAPLYVGDKTQKGEVFADKKVYTWKVAMYNAKYSNAAKYSNVGRFFMEVQTNGYKYGSANVAVRYFGPKSSYAKNGSTIRVRAYTSPDFTGIPVAAGYVAMPDSVTDTTVTNANCTVIGIPEGTYYLQAFIDSNSNGVCDKWETQGYLCPRSDKEPIAEYLDPTAITFDSKVGAGDLAIIYLEDADTDGDGLPDAWEYAEFGSLAAKGVEKLSETLAGEFVVNVDLSAAMAKPLKGKAPTAGLEVEIGSRLKNLGVLALAMGAETEGYDSFAAAIRGYVSPELVEDGVRITSLDLMDGKVSIKVEAETETSGSAWVKGSKELTVWCQVQWKPSLADSVWTDLGKPFEITVGTEEAEEIDISDRVPEGDSGYFSVKVYKK